MKRIGLKPNYVPHLSENRYIFIDRATGGDRSDREYSKLRLELLRDIESVCKHIFDEAGISHSDRDDC